MSIAVRRNHTIGWPFRKHTTPFNLQSFMEVYWQRHDRDVETRLALAPGVQSMRVMIEAKETPL